MSLPLNRYLEILEAEARFNRDAADQMTEAIDNAHLVLTDGLGADTGRIINVAFEALWNLRDAFARKGRRK